MSARARRRRRSGRTGSASRRRPADGAVHRRISWRSLAPTCGDIGWFVGGSDNIGAFDGLGDTNATSGDGNVGAFEGLGNGGADDGDGNVGAFNGNLNGTGNTSSTNGNSNGNDNIGAFDGNFDGNFIVGSNSGNGNGNANLGSDNGNADGNGTAPTSGAALRGCTTSYTGGFDTVVVGNGNDTITAMAELSTIDAGCGNDEITIGGILDTVVAGNGADVVNGCGTAWAVVDLGNGNDRVCLSGGYDIVTTGCGNDIISVTGRGNWIDAGSSTTFNEIHGGCGGDTFVIDPGQGYDKIYGFSLRNGDVLDLAKFDAPGGWDGKMNDLTHWFATVVSGGDTVLESRSKSGHLSLVAELMGVSAPLSSLARSVTG